MQMRGYITAEEAAEKLGFEYTYFTRLLNDGRVTGAEKWQGVWLIPEDAKVERFSPGRKKVSKN
jgi:hypothetical protein